ncbi:amino acid adenylation domain-containing protein [Rhodococcus sp. UNC363MFTsu5.1]|uniref:amino acid adenylation domain-containing protein n=1 Tax=Rhodococcus sp. UNC363MFTsu5.1 TaxID=1449069 RepID=UPI000A7B40CD|nr:non-ribosomal peptide synthetase [Rhodococcus sp. UNC363MFTsu5.1]
MLDQHLRLVPPGVPGELYIGGPLVLARGYGNRVALTASRFVANPFRGVGERMYQSGDVVYWNADGELEYVGRTDFQVKIRGLRVELGEIEAALSADSRVGQVAVVVKTTVTGVDRLVAYVVPAGGSEGLAEAVVEVAGRALPDYMVPSAVVVLDEIPLTPSGKLDRKALPDPEFGGSEADHVDPIGATEEAIAAVYGELLGLDRVSAADSFFTLGGDSLVATRAVARVNAAAGAALRLRDLYEAPTVAELAARVDAAGASGAHRPALAPRPRTGRIPLSLAQQRMWFLNQFDTASAVYNVPMAIRLSGRVDLDAMRAALADVLGRHESLRTVFPDSVDGPHQVIVDADEVDIEVDVVAVTEADLAEQMLAFASRGFDVTAEIPWRVRIFEIGAAEHVLLISTHHISSDGSSVAPLARDLVTAYVARAAGAAPQWAPLEVQYADFSLWQREVLGDESDPDSVLAKQIGFWRDRLAGLPELLELPTDRVRPASPSYRGESVEFTVGAELHRGLRELARTHDASLFMVVHAAFAVLLERLSGQQDIAIGSPIAGRGERALDDLVGMFVNTLVLRTRIDPDQTFADLLADVRSDDVDAFGHADIPFERLVEALEVPRSTAHQPLFQVALSMANTERATLELPDLEVGELAAPLTVAKFDLQLSLGENPDTDGAAAGITAVLDYATDLFDLDTARSFAERLVRILEAVVAEPTTAVGDIGVLSAAERGELTTPAPVEAGPVTLAELLTMNVRLHPDDIALVFGDVEWSYRELDERANRLARELIARGAAPDTVVAFALRRSLESVLAIWAIAKTGAAYMPVDPRYPVERIAEMFGDADPIAVLTIGEHLDRLPESVAAVVLDDPETVSAVAARHSGAMTESDLLGAVHVDQIAYVIYTSGSTGKPKGVLVPHRGLSTLATDIIRLYETTRDSRQLHVCAPNFDASVGELIAAFGVGATLVVAPADVFGGEELAELIGRQGVTGMVITPNALATVDPAGLDSLRTVIVGGDVCTPELAARWSPGRTFRNAYGPTETTVIVTATAPLVAGEPVTIGAPMGGVSAFVLDSRLRPVPRGVLGELYLAGPDLARGYHDRFAITADRFVANPYGPAGSRMYRTGDVVRWVARASEATGDATAELEYVGRSDFQVKVRGLRVELGEIDSVLGAHDSVEFVATVPHVLPTGTTVLVAYVLPAAGHDLDPTALTAFASERLPAHMVPGTVLRLDAIPLTSNGKLDRKGLPEPVFEQSGEFVAPRNPIEEVVAGVFADVLGVDRVSVGEDFFDAGGNSLVATRVIARVNAALGVRLGVRELFDAPTVAALAVAAASAAGRDADRPALVAGPRPDRVPLSMAQKRIWFLNQFDTASAAYNIPLGVRLTGDIDVAALEAAMRDVLARHESLRTVFPSDGDAPHQVIRSVEDSAIGLELVRTAESDLMPRAIEFARRGFDVSAELPVRAMLFEVEGPDAPTARDHVLMVVVHHISADGASMAPLARDVMLAYVARSQGQAPQWEPLAVQYADFALWQREALGAETDPDSVISNQVAHWREMLDGLPDLLELPTDRPRPAVQSLAGERHEFAVPAELALQVDRLARASGATPFMVMQAAYAVLLAHLSGTGDIAVGTAVAGRGEEALDPIVGMFVNTLVLRTRVDSGASFESVLESVREGDLQAFSHADLPFERLVEILDPPRSTAHAPLVQVSFGFENMDSPVFELPGLTVAAMPADLGQAKNDLELAFSRHGEAGNAAELRGTFVYATALFDRATVERMARRYVRILEAVVADPSVVVGDLDLLDAAERERMLVEFNRTRVPVESTTLVELLDRSVLRNPDAPAMTFEDVTLSFAEFDARVNRLARHLISLGVGPEDRVVLAARRSMEMLVGMYAVMKAGGAYVPVDPDQPADRIERVLELARPVCVLTTSWDDAALPEGATVVEIDRVDVAHLAATPITDAERVRPLHRGNPAYVIFTSGSTGVPKGVSVSHEAIVNQLSWFVGEYEMTAADVVIQKTPTVFDPSVWELFVPFIVGGHLVIAKPEGHRDAEYLIELSRRHGATVLGFVPSMLAAFLAGPELAFPPSVRALQLAGEALSPELAARTMRASDVRINNAYGPAETTLTSVHYWADGSETTTMPIGIPVWNSQAYVLDERLHPVAPGVRGELYLSGGQVARGYHDRPALTAERFVANPYSAEPGAVMYRTGDVARWGSDGQLEYLGRTDFQVKLRGQRIELGEIEAALLEQPSVEQAVVVAADTERGKRLVGYVVGAGVEASALQSVLSATLPGYMVPDSIVVLEVMPVTGNGKLDRKALPAPDFGGDEHAYVAPRTPAEVALAAVFAEVLGVDRVSVEESFFALGGDSIMSIQLVTRAKAAGLWLTARQVFEHRTVAALATVAEDDSARTRVLDELPGGGVGEFPATPIMAEFAERGGLLRRFSQSNMVTLPAGITAEVLEATVQAVLDRHDALRMRWYADGSGGTVAEPGGLAAAEVIRRIDLDTAPGDEAYASSIRAEFEAAADRLDPVAGVVAQFVWFAPADQAANGRLLMVVHHLAVDGVSWRILLPDFASAWGQIHSGAQPELAPTGTSLRRWAHGLVEAAAGRRGELAHWREVQGGDDPVLGSRAVDPEIDVVETTRTVRVEASAETTEALLTAVPETFRGSVNDGLLAALALAVARWRADRGVQARATLVGLEGHGREEETVPGADLSRTVGWFTSLFPVRLDVAEIDIVAAFDGGASTVELVKSVKEQLRQVPDKGIGYGLLRHLDAEGSAALAGGNAPQIGFNYLGRAGSVEITDEMRSFGWVPAGDDVELGSALDPRMPVTALDINAVVQHVDGRERLTAAWAFPTGVLSEAEVDELARLWVAALDAVARAVDAPGAEGQTPSDLPLVSLTQRQIDGYRQRFPALRDIWSLSPLQYGMYFHASLAEGVAVDVYTAQMVMGLAGDVDAERMRRAGQALIDRHETFRTAFVTDDSGVAVQVLLDGAELPFQVLDLSQFDRAGQDAERTRLAAEDRERPFDLSAPPLMRFLLVRLAPQRYELIVMTHHMVTDGWSTPLIIKELLFLYLTDGDARALPSARTYRDYLAWLGDRDLPSSRRVWADTLAGVEGSTLLVSGDRGRTQTSTTGHHELDLSVESTTRATALARELGVTPNTLVQVAWSLVLAGLTGRDDVVFGATVSGRPPEIDGVESMIGLFINTLPVRATLRPAETVAGLLGRIQREQADLLDHHFVGLADIQRQAGDAAMFDTLVVFESYPVDMAGATSETDIAGMRVAGVSGVDAAHYPVALTVSLGETLHLKFMHVTELVDARQIAALADRFVGVLDQLVADPSARVAALAVTSAEERAVLAPVAGLPSVAQTTLPELLTAAAADRSRVALVHGGDGSEMTYGELDDRSNALARLLIDRGAGPETFVAYALPRSIAAQVVVWAIAKTGATFVPLDIKYPADRIEHMVTDSGALVGITDRAHVDALPGGVDWLLLDDPAFEAELGRYPSTPVTDADRSAPLHTGHGAYMVYTSGSTGKPKGVLVTHTGLADFARQQREHYSITASSRTLHFASPSFDGAVLELLLAVGAGATMVIVPTGIVGGQELADQLRRHRVTHGFVTTAALGTVDPTGLDEFTNVAVGGEAVSAELIAKWAPGRNLFDVYGPTETSMVITMSRPTVPGERITIGGPIRGADALVLDSMLRPVPVGVSGELYFAGPALARGYHNRFDLTADRFVANPFGSAGSRMYRTGDVVRWVDGHGPDSGNAGGLEIEYVGRSDFQLKIRGFRIELGEIDGVLSAHPAVDTAVTLGRTGPSGATLLVAYVVPAPGRSVDAGELTAHVGQSLPTHMVPAAVVVLDAIPLTVNGKVDRRALPDPDFGSAVEDHVAPSTETERVLAELFAEVLGVERVGVTDSFFELGGDSIVSIQLVARAKAAGLRLRTRDVFEHRTVAALAQVVAPIADGAAETLAELPGGGVGDMPLTPIMRWMTERQGGHDRLLMPAYLALPAGIDRAGLVATLSAVVQRHDMLRAAIPPVEGEPILRVAPEVDVDGLLTRVEFGPDALPGTAGFDALAGPALESAAAELNLTTGDVARYVWFDPAPGTDAVGRLLLVVHHLVVDGVSWRLLVGDLFTAWQAIAAGDAPEPAPVATSMRRWAHALAEEAVRPAREAELDHWTAVVEAEDPLLTERPLDPSRDLFADIAEVSVELTPETTDALLTAVPAAVRGGVDDGLLTVLALAVVAWRERRGVAGSSALIKLEGHGREEDVVPGADLSRTVGWFTSMYPVRLDLHDIDAAAALAGGAAVGDALKSVKEQLRAVPEKGIGYGLLRYLNPRTAPALAGHPLPQIGFNYLGRMGGGEEQAVGTPVGWLPAPAGELSVSAAPDPDLPAAAAIDINAEVSGDRLTARFAFPQGLLTRDEVDEFAQLWARAAQAVVAWAVPAEGQRRQVFTPSDLPLVRIGQAEIDRLERRYPSLEDVWSLTPLQQGMVFHATLAESSTSLDVYTSQVVVNLGGIVDADRMRAAAQALVDRHPNLRAGFVHDEDGNPLQVVVGRAEVAFRSIDVAGLPEAEAAERLRRVRADDRNARFDLAAPPLVRLSLVHTAADRYELVLTTHHLLVDGWSMPLIFRDLVALYATRGDASAFPPARSYREFLAWLGAQDAEASLDAWTRSLAGTEDPTLLAPEDRGREQSSMPEVLTLDLDGGRTGALESLARDLGVTLNTVVQAAWGLVLSRLVGRDDVVFGATVSGRPAALPGVESMVGMFINTLPVRVRLDRGETLRELLSRVQLEQSELLEHHHVGLPEIQQRAGAGAVFDTITVFESYPVDATSAGGDGDIDGMRLLGVEGVDANTFPLSLYIEQGEKLEIQAKYLPDVFGREQMQSVIDRIDRVLARLVDAPESTVAQLEVLSGAELARLDELNATDHEIPAATLADLFDVQVARTPDAVALVFEGQELTYAEFDARANRLARHLIEMGVGPESMVGLGIRRSLDLMIGMYAIVKAGGAYVPIDPDHPADRTNYVLETAAPVCVLTTSRDRFEVDGRFDMLEIDRLDVSGHAATPVTDADRQAPLHLDNSAYVMFTSGSTGKPKGVVVTHRAIVNQLVWKQSEYGLGADDVVLQQIAMTFDVSVWEFFWALQNGARLVIAKPDGHKDPSYLAEVIAEHGVTTATFVPSPLGVFVAVADAASLRTLKRAFVIGEALPPETAARWRELTDAGLHNMYGPTEAAVSVTNWEARAEDTVTTPIGLPQWNVQVHVLDAGLRPTPAGVAGELYLAGPQLARGYLTRPGITSDRFVANPYGAAGERMYRTGDLVRRRGDGVLEYIGRTDFQVKLRGQRIELEEIESAVLGHTSVLQTAVLVVQDERTGDQLVAYVVPEDGREVDGEELKRFVGGALPAYMVPNAVVVLDEFPLNASGKLDRKQLPVPEFADAGEYRAPSTATEATVAGVLAEVLGLERVSVDASFFDLGGNSLTATRVMARLAEELGVTVPLRAVFMDPTAAGIAAAIEGDADGAAGEAGMFDVLLPIRTAGDRPPVFVVHPVLGLSWAYSALSSVLDPRIPIYGLQSPAASGDTALPGSIEEIADRYVTEIRSVQPEGPYRLVGWSLGGVIAHAMAVRLQADGQQVERLVMLDSFAGDAADQLGEQAVTAEEILGGFGIAGAAELDPEAASIDEVLALLRESTGGPLSAVSEDWLRQMVASATNSIELMHRYVPPTVDGDMVLFTAAHGREDDSVAARSWAGAVSGSVRHRSVHTTHWAMLSPEALSEIGPVLRELMSGPVE